MPSVFIFYFGIPRKSGEMVLSREQSVGQITRELYVCFIFFAVV